MERLDGVVRTNAMAGGFGAETRAFPGFIRKVPAMLIRRGYQRVVLRLRNDVKGLGHNGRECCESGTTTEWRTVNANGDARLFCG